MIQPGFKGFNSCWMKRLSLFGRSYRLCLKTIFLSILGTILAIKYIIQNKFSICLHSRFVYKSWICLHWNLNKKESILIGHTINRESSHCILCHVRSIVSLLAMVLEPPTNWIKRSSSYCCPRFYFAKRAFY